MINAENKKIDVNLENSEGSIFMGIDELCNTSNSNEYETEASVFVDKSSELNIDIIYRELLQEKFLELTKYVKLNRYFNTISIDKTALITEGYQVFIH